MIVLSVKNLSKAFGIDEILKDVSFNINEGEKVSLIGSNGSGKSTLFKIITKSLDYDTGDIFIDKGKTLGYLSQNLSLGSHNTIYEEMLTPFSNLLSLEKKIKALETELSLPYDEAKEDYHNKIIEKYTESQEIYKISGGYTYKGEISRVLQGLGFFEEDFTKKISILSGGQKTRLALSKLLLTKPDILLLDEPTNHLDLPAIEWLEEYLKSYKGTILLISHDRFFLDEITERTFEMVNGKIIEYSGNYSFYIKQKGKNYSVMLKAYNKQQTEINRQEEIIERYRSFNREKSIKAAESRQKRLDKVEVLEKPVEDKGLNRIVFKEKIKSGRDALIIEDLSKSFNDKELFSGINLNLKREDKLALIGDNGIGKTTLFKIILGEERQSSGNVLIGKNVVFGYYDQEQKNLDMNKTILDEVWDTYPDLTVKEIRSYLGHFLFSEDDVFKKISKLSGGEKCRISLLKLVLSNSNFLLLDEPTNHLDIPSREALEEALLSYEGTVLLISHDRYFLNKIAEKIIELKNNGITTYLGNYSYYSEKKKKPDRFEEVEKESSVNKTELNNIKKKKRETEKKEREKSKEISSIESEIAELEEQIKKLNQMLCSEEIYSSFQESSRINESIKENEEKLQMLYIKWEELI
ncbi:MAG: ABC-F family ATP-binding cassette domain-containing protein [Clostridiaceae bacterium]